MRDFFSVSPIQLTARALNDLGQQRAEAFQQYNTQAVNNFSALTESRATALSNLTGARMTQLMTPANAAAQRASQLDSLMTNRNDFLRAQVSSRSGQAVPGGGGTGSGGSPAPDWVGKAADGVAGALPTAGRVLDKYLGNGPARPDTVQVPVYEGPAPAPGV